MLHELVVPDFNCPIDVGEYVRGVPASATIKAMFLSTLLDTPGADRSRLPDGQRRHVAFKDYPLVDQVTLVATVAATLYPKLSLREVIRRIGPTSYPTFAASLVGRVTFAAAGRDPGALLTAAAKAINPLQMSTRPRSSSWRTEEHS